MATKATSTTKKTQKVAEVKPNKLQQAFIDSGIKKPWVMTNIVGNAPDQDDLDSWQKLIEPLSAMIDVEEIAQAAHDSFYGVEAEQAEDVEEEEEVEVKPKGKKSSTTVSQNGKAQAINVVVNQAKEIADMSPGELLALLVNEPDNDDAYDAFVSHQRVIPLLNKTPNIMAALKGGGFDIQKTQNYWRRLRNPLSQPLTKFQGARLVTVDKALGRIEKILVHPVFAGEYINAGYDNDNQDWSEVDRELMEAVLWARQTKHRAFPKNPDPYAVYGELTAEDLSPRWDNILEDYQAFLDDGGQRVTLVYIAPGQNPAEAQAKTVVSGTDASTGARRGFGVSLKADW